MIKLSPSLLSADFANLKSDIKAIERAGTQFLHLDVIDGHFAPNITFGVPIIKSIRPVTDMIFDVHLMISEPEKYIDDFAKAGADILNVHAEACENLKLILEKIKSLGIKSAVTIKPDTPVSKIEDVLEHVDMVLIMSVYPGFSGQTIIFECLEKIRNLVQIRKDKNLTFEIEIDGGVKLDNVREVIEAGADIIVTGSAVFGNGNTEEAARQFLDIFKEYE